MSPRRRGGKKGAGGKRAPGENENRSDPDGPSESGEARPPNDAPRETAFADMFGKDMDGIRRIERGPARIEPNRRRRPAARKKSGESSKPTFRWPNDDEALRAAAAGVSDQQLLSLSRGEPPFEEKIDLHGMRREPAAAALAKRIADASARGLRVVLVVHGRGHHSATHEAVLREKLPGWLTKGPTASLVLGFCPAPERLGGDGATLVLLRRARS